MKRVLLSMMCMSASMGVGCGAGGGAEQEDVSFGKLDGVTDRSDIKVVGDIASGETRGDLAYTGRPKYRALRFHAQVGDELEAWVRSDDGDAMGWIIDSEGQVLAKNDDAELDVANARVTATVEDEAEAFYVVFREASKQQATFEISLSGGTPASGGGGPVLQVGTPAGASDGFMIEEARIDGQELVVAVRYGGGCEKHDFKLFWDGKTLESLPPKVNLVLTHDGHGDACEALKAEELRFGLAPLADVNADNITIQLKGGDKPVSLSYRPSRVAAVIVGQPSGPRDGFGVMNPRIDGNVLKLTATFGGGCEAHDFKLFWDGNVRETFPAQASLVLTHDGHGDACEALLAKPLEFDLSKLGEAAGGKVRLSISGGDQPVSVEYDPR